MSAITYSCQCGTVMTAEAASGALASAMLHGQQIRHVCAPRDPVDVVEARQVVLAAIRRHPVALGYLNAAAIEAHAADIVVALAEAGHLR